MAYWKPRRIIFTGSQSPLLKILSRENETEVVSSVSFMANLAQRFLPDLIVFDGLDFAGIGEVKAIPQFARVPILILEDSFSQLNNLTPISIMPGILICNTTVAMREPFIENLKLILSARKKILPPKTGSKVKYAILFLNKNLGRKLTRSAIASQLGTNPDYLTRIFKAETGTGFWNYLTILRLEEAKKLLETTGLMIREISDRCGFSDPAYFTNSFRKEFGTSPAAFRTM